MKGLKETGSIAIALAMIAAEGSAWSKDVERTPLSPDHPLIGTWRVDVPSLRCFEVYEVRQDGTTRVTSASEVAESNVDISTTPSAKGFYRWTDQIVKNNGQPDCAGQSVPAGDVVTNFAILNPSKDQFLLCQKEDLSACLGPFVKSKGI